MNEASDSKCVTRKWSIVNDQSNANYNVRSKIIYNTKVLKSNLCDYNDAYILVKGHITVVGDNGTQASFKNSATFTKCITKIDETTIGDAENLDLVMLMCNLLEYCSNYSDKTGSLWFYSKNEATNSNADIGSNVDIKLFEYKTKLLEDKVAQPVPNNNNGILRYATITLPLKYKRNFRRSLEMPFANWINKVELKLK